MYITLMFYVSWLLIVVAGECNSVQVVDLISEIL